MNRREPLYVIMFMTLLMAIIAILLSSIQYLTRPLLVRNAEFMRNRVFCRAFGTVPAKEDALSYKKIYADSIRFDSLSGRYHSIDNKKVGIEFTANGFWDKIRGVMVLDSKLQKFINIQFLEQHETPGLGARIEESSFTNQFAGLEIDWTNESGTFISIGSNASTGKNNRIDAVTGATQTSLALMNGLNGELSRLKAEIRK